MIKSIKQNASLATTDPCSARENLYQELGFKGLLRDRLWYRKLSLHCNIRHNFYPLYLTECLPVEKYGCYSLR